MDLRNKLSHISAVFQLLMNLKKGHVSEKRIRFEAGGLRSSRRAVAMVKGRSKFLDGNDEKQ